MSSIYKVFRKDSNSSVCFFDTLEKAQTYIDNYFLPNDEFYIKEYKEADNIIYKKKEVKSKFVYCDCCHNKIDYGNNLFIIDDLNNTFIFCSKKCLHEFVDDNVSTEVTPDLRDYAALDWITK